MLTMLAPGTKVLITRDVRKLPPEQLVSGQIGIYEGDFPVSVSAKFAAGYREFDYAFFMKLNAELESPFPSIEEAMASGDPNWKNKPFYMVEGYPRILLPDGSHIWGYECWWGVAEGAPPLAEAQVQTEQMIELLRSTMKGK